MRIADAYGLLSWPLGVARAASAELGARVDPIARLISRRLGRHRSASTDGAELPAAPAVDLREHVEHARFWLGPAQPTAQPAVWGALLDPEPGELPDTYGVDRAVVVPRDPWWLFVFWEITPAKREAALAALGNDAEHVRPTLRVLDVTFVDPRGNPSLSFDVEVPATAESWYVNVGRPAASYCVEVGLRTTSGIFLPLVRSNVAATPRATPSPDRKVRWLEFGPTGPAWSSEQRNGRAAPSVPSGDALLAPSD